MSGRYFVLGALALLLIAAFWKLRGKSDRKAPSRFKPWIPKNE